MKNMRAGRWFVTLVLSLLSLASAQSDRTGWPNELNFGVIPVEATQETTARFQPFVDYLQQELGMPVRFTMGADYTAVITAMQFKNLDVAYFSPSAYIEANSRAGAEAFAREDTITSGAGYHSIIVSRADSGIETMADARGKTFAFVDPNSTTGYLLPLNYFRSELSINPEDYFSQVIFSSSHEVSIEGVAGGIYDVAVSNDQEIEIAIYDGEITSREDLNVLWQSELVPSSPLAYRGDLPESFKTAIREAVLGFKDTETLSELRLKGFVPTTDQDYDPIRQLEAQVRSASSTQ